MLLFNTKNKGGVKNECRISKHLMLLFNNKDVTGLTFELKFQNISCYCLTEMYQTEDSHLLNFKTSHVIV